MDIAISASGGVTRDPELKYLASGTAVASFGLAVNERKFNKTTSEWDETVSFFNVAAFGSLAEKVATSVTKGTRVVVTGKLVQSRWETADGEKRDKVEIVASDVGMSMLFHNVTSDRATRTSGSRPASTSTSEPF